MTTPEEATMITKYRISLSNAWDCSIVIERIEVERETDASVWIRGRRSAKRSEHWWSYYPTKEDARKALLARQERRTEACEEALRMARSRLDKIEKL